MCKLHLVMRTMPNHDARHMHGAMAELHSQVKIDIDCTFKCMATRSSSILNSSVVPCAAPEYTAYVLCKAIAQQVFPLTEHKVVGRLDTQLLGKEHMLLFCGNGGISIGPKTW